MLSYLLLAAVLIGSWRWPGLLIVGALLTYQSSMIANFAGLTTIYTISALGVALLKSFPAIGRARLNLVDFSLLLFMGVYLISTARSFFPEQALASFTSIFAASVSMYLLGRLATLVTEPGHLAKQILYGIVFFGTAFSLIILAQYDSSMARLRVGDATAVGITQPFPLELTATVIAIFAAGIQRRLFLLLILLFALFVIAYASVLSGTRGVFVSFFVGAFVALALYVRNVRVWAALAVVAALGLAVYPFLSLDIASPLQASIGRLLTNFSDDTTGLDLSSQLRLEQQLLGLDVWAINPIFGAGAGGYNAITGRGYPHNVFIEVAANAGLVGVLSILTFIGFVLFYLFNGADNFSRAIILSLFFAALTHMQLSFALDMAKPFFLIGGVSAGWAAALLASQRQSGAFNSVRPYQRNKSGPFIRSRSNSKQGLSR